MAFFNHFAHFGSFVFPCLQTGRKNRQTERLENVTRKFGTGFLNIAKTNVGISHPLKIKHDLYFASTNLWLLVK